VRELLDTASARLGGPTSATAAAVFGHWADQVGPDIAAHARPLSLHDGVLTLEVDQPAWAAQLRYMEAEILARLAASAGGAEVARLAVRVAGARPRRPRPPRA
jgi:predicted nucleic acid-binding Zn ribbon protein